MLASVSVALGLSLIGVVAVIGIYNRVVVLRNHYRNAFAQIDVQLKRRYDLVPNLVESAKAYLEHERETLERVIAARNVATSARERAAEEPGEPAAMRTLARAESELTGSLKRLMVVAEDYPELKANETIAQLSEELTSTENKIAFARQAYNDSVMRYNIGREKFPVIVVAQKFGFGPAQALELESPEERRAPRVSF